MAGILAGCTPDNATAAEPVSVDKSKVAVVYFSWSPDGNTRFAAQTIAAKAGAKIFEIKAEKPYSTNYRTCCDEAKPECYGKQLRPIQKIEGLNLAQYDVIFVGSPNWWGTMAPPVATFLTSYDLKGKTVVPFFTHGGGGVQNCERDVRKLCSGSNLPQAGVFSGGSVRRSGDAIANWVSKVVTVKK